MTEDFIRSFARNLFGFDVSAGEELPQHIDYDSVFEGIAEGKMTVDPRQNVYADMEARASIDPPAQNATTATEKAQEGNSSGLTKDEAETAFQLYAGSADAEERYIADRHKLAEGIINRLRQLF